MGPDPPPMENMGFLSNTGLDPLKNHKARATKPAIKFGLLSERQLSELADDGPLIVLFVWIQSPL